MSNRLEKQMGYEERKSTSLVLQKMLKNCALMKIQLKGMLLGRGNWINYGMCWVKKFTKQSYNS
jgi:hypothetical protein